MTCLFSPFLRVNAVLRFTVAVTLGIYVFIFLVNSQSNCNSDGESGTYSGNENEVAFNVGKFQHRKGKPHEQLR
jgi:hypothetical protein